MKPSDIVLIRFPQTDLQMGKLRPALVVAITPGQHADIVLVLISSRIYQAIPEFDEIIEASDEDFEATGLKVRSIVRLARIATVESSIVTGQLGVISDERLQRIRSRLAHWLKG